MIATAPVTRLMVEMTRRALGQDPVEPLESSDGDWERVLDLARSECLAALIYSGLRESHSHVPAEAMSRLKASYLAAVLGHQAWLEPGLEAITGALRAANIEPIVLKGAALAYTSYPHPAQRSMADIDLLVPSADVIRAVPPLIQIGFRIDPSCAHASHHLPALCSPDGQVRVELHHHVILSPNPYAIDEDEMRSRAARIAAGDSEVTVLSPADALQLVCVHLSYSHRYGWLPLRAFVDILAIASNDMRSPDWHLLVDSAKRWRTSGAVYWPLELSRQLLAAPIPQHVTSKLAPSRPMKWLLSAVLRPDYLLDRSRPRSAGESYLRSHLVSLSLYAGCSRMTQARATLASIRRTLSLADRPVSL